MQSTEIEQSYQITTGGVFPGLDTQINRFLAGGLLVGVATTLVNGDEALAANSGVDGNGSSSVNSIDETSAPDGASAGTGNGEGAPGYTKQYGLWSPEEYEELSKTHTIIPGDRLDNITPIDEPNDQPAQEPAHAPTSTDAKNLPSSQTTAKTSDAKATKNTSASSKTTQKQPVTSEETATAEATTTEAATTAEDAPLQGTIESIPHFTVKPGIELVDSGLAAEAQANVKSGEAPDLLGLVSLSALVAIAGYAAYGGGLFRRRQPGKHSIRK